MIKKRYLSSLFLVASVSLIGTGFSSWSIINQQIDDTQGTISITNEISFVDLKNTMNYIIGSESGFEYYIFDEIYYFTETSYSIDLKINPLEMQNLLSYKQLTLYFGISYTLPTSYYYNIFSSNNVYTTPPVIAKYKLKHFPNFYLESNKVTTSSKINGNNTIYTLSSCVSLFGDDNSLCMFAAKYQKDNEDIYLNVSYDFELLNSFSNSITNFLSIDMNFYLSITGTTGA